MPERQLTRLKPRLARTHRAGDHRRAHRKHRHHAGRGHRVPPDAAGPVPAVARRGPAGVDPVADHRPDPAGTGGARNRARGETAFQLALLNQRRAALADAYMAQTVIDGVSEEAIEALYAREVRQRAAGARRCARPHIVVKDKAQAEELRKQIEAGEEFATLAAAAQHRRHCVSVAEIAAGNSTSACTRPLPAPRANCPKARSPARPDSVGLAPDPRRWQARPRHAAAGRRQGPAAAGSEHAGRGQRRSRTPAWRCRRSSG